MTSRSERLLFTHRRLIHDLETQCKRIGDFDETTPPRVLIGRKTILEKLWDDLTANGVEVENVRGWIGDEEYIKECSDLHDIYCEACDHLTQ